VNHAPFLIGSYAATAIVLAALLAWVVLDGRAVARRLAALEARGIRRRPEKGGAGA
jgi:heme exporter protein D